MTATATEMSELEDALPAGALVTDAAITEGYRRDWARDPNAGRPVAVVRATCTADVQAVLVWASRHGVPVVPRGAGSGLSGGSSAVDGCIGADSAEAADLFGCMTKFCGTQCGLTGDYSMCSR